MNPKEIIEGNKLIAEFFGEKVNKPNNIDGFKEMVRLKSPDGKIGNWAYGQIPDFSLLWDWLMPVIEKIESLGYDTQIDFGYNPYSKRADKMHYWTQIAKDQTADAIYGSSIKSKRESVWKAVIEFVKWYNKKNK